MTRSKKLLYALGGFVVGVLLTAAVWLYADSRPAGNMDGNLTQDNQTEEPSVKEDGKETEEPPVEEDQNETEEPPVEEDKNETEEPPVEEDKNETEEPPVTEDKNETEEPPVTEDENETEEPPVTEDENEMGEPPVEEDKNETEEPPVTEDKNETGEPPVEEDENETEEPPVTEDENETEKPTTEDTISPMPNVPVWDATAVYIGGDTISYQGRRYRAKWWTQGEQPDRSDVWEDLGVLDGEAVQPDGVSNAPIDAAVPQDTELTDFKVVGYYPSWKPDKLQFVDFSVVTHVCYAFAIPTSDGGLRDLENPETAKELIRSAHANGAKVLLSIGGWSYNDTPLEGVFMEATADSAKVQRFAENIFAMCEEYGFDGVDMDWEHPRVDGSSARQYEALMLVLSEKLHAVDKLLTTAVLSGATADGNIYYDAAAHTNAVLNAVDFINVMAYDGGDGERHSQYQFAVNCGTYWKETRGLPAYKVVLGVPFYARPSWADYGTILESVPDAYSKDHTNYNGMEAYYNGVDTIAKKTVYAKENLGGIMIWELTQDTKDADKSLLQTIGKNAK